MIGSCPFGGKASICRFNIYGNGSNKRIKCGRILPVESRLVVGGLYAGVAAFNALTGKAVSDNRNDYWKV